MARKTTTILLALLIAAGLHGQQGQQVSNANKTNSLKGLSSLGVHVIYSNEEDGTNRFLDNTLRTEIELRIRQAGIQVRESDLAMLTLNVTRWGGMDLTLIEPATLDRGSTRVWATVWRVTASSPCTCPLTAVDSRRTIYDAVSEFLNQWLTDNPAPKLQLPTKIYQ